MSLYAFAVGDPVREHAIDPGQANRFSTHIGVARDVLAQKLIDALTIVFAVGVFVLIGYGLYRAYKG